jgi:hypothetical protein
MGCAILEENKKEVAAGFRASSLFPNQYQINGNNKKQLFCKKCFYLFAFKNFFFKSISACFW